jgi:hypothetical protein
VRRRSHRLGGGPRPAARRGGHERGAGVDGVRGGGGSGETSERIATIAVTLRAFARASGAEAAMLLLDRGDGGQPFVVECAAEGPIVLVEGERGVELEPDRLVADPLPLPAVPAPPERPIAPAALRPALAASARAVGPRPPRDGADDAGEPADAARGPADDAATADAARVDPNALATAAALASAMRSLIALFPGRSVLTATFPTADEEVPFHLAVRIGDPIVASLGGQQFELPLGWPA